MVCNRNGASPCVDANDAWLGGWKSYRKPRTRRTLVATIQEQGNSFTKCFTLGIMSCPPGTVTNS